MLSCLFNEEERMSFSADSKVTSPFNLSKNWATYSLIEAIQKSKNYVKGVYRKDFDDVTLNLEEMIFLF